MRALPFVTLMSAVLLGGCAAVATRGETAAAGPLPDDSLNATAWYQASLERDLVYREVYRAAAAHLDDALADPSWDALPRGDRDTPADGLPPSPAIIQRAAIAARSVLNQRGMFLLSQ